MKVLTIIGFLIVSGVVQNQKQTDSRSPTRNLATYAYHASAAFPQIPSGLRGVSPARQQGTFHQRARRYLSKAFGPEYLATWILVAVAVAGIVYTIRTLKTLERQTKATEVAAVAAKLSADAARLSQRATLIAEFPKDPPHGFSVGGRPAIRVDIRNMGATVARHCVYNIWKELLPVAFVDFTVDKEIYESPFPTTIFPEGMSPTTITVMLDRELSEKDMFYIKGGQAMLCFRIHIDYKDAFGDSRWSEFGYEFNGEHLGALPKYNDSD